MKIYSATISSEVLKVRSRESYYARQKRLFILFVVLVSILPLFFIGFASKQYYRESWMQRTSVDLKGSAENRKEIIDRFLANQEDLLASLIELYGLTGLAKQENLEKIFPAVNRSGVLIDLGVIDAKGNHLAYVGPYRNQLAGKNYRNAAWFEETMRAGRYVSDVFSGYRGEPHFVVTATDTNRTWILRATINSALFNALLAKTDVGPDGDAFILNRKGDLQTVSRNALMAADTTTAMPAEELESFIAASETTVHRQNNFLYVTAWVNEKSWLLVLKTNINSSLTPFYRAWNLGLLSISIASIFILLVATLLVRSMMDRIEVADKERMLLNNRIREADKMALIGRLAASVAHEVNNPLQIIGDQADWICELLEEEAKPNLINFDEYQSAAQKIKHHVRRASTITHRLLGFSRSREYKRVEQDLNSLLKDTIAFLENEAKHHRITLRLNLQEPLVKVLTDPSQLQQVFLNIINNAIDAIGNDGTITIQTSMQGERLLVEFADSGPGLPQEHLQKVFDPFFTTKNAAKGTGLGLSISRNIMQRLGGDIQARNGKQGGCHFSVSLPIPPGTTR